MGRQTDSQGDELQSRSDDERQTDQGRGMSMKIVAQKQKGRGPIRERVSATEERALKKQKPVCPRGYQCSETRGDVCDVGRPVLWLLRSSDGRQP